MCFFQAIESGADPGWSVRGDLEAKIGIKGANFARFWPILEGAVPPRPPSGSATDRIHMYLYNHRSQHFNRVVKISGGVGS